MANRRNNNRRGNGNKSKEDFKDKLHSKSNDPSWYAADPALVRDTASFPFSRPVGTRIGYDYRHNEVFGSAADTYGFAKSSIPGIMRYLVIPTCGLSRKPTSAVNVAAQAMYSFVRHANSGHANYEAADLMLYMLGNSQIYGAINYLMRIYATALMYSQKNRWLPKYLLQSDGIDFDNIMGNLANFRYGINLLINKASALAVPSTFTLFNRHAFLFQNYYLEGESVKDQIYYYAPQYFFKFALDEDGSGMLTPAIHIHGELEDYDFESRDQNNLLSAQDLLDYVNQIIDAMLNEEDFGIMSGDILKAYGQNIIKLASINEDYTIGLIRDDIVLTQMKNSTPIYVEGHSSLLSTNIHQVEGNIIYEPVLRGEDNYISAMLEDVLNSSKPLSFDKAEVTSEDVIEATRLMCYLEPNEVSPTYSHIGHGSEICVRATMFRLYFTGPSNQVIMHGYDWQYAALIDYNDAGVLRREISRTTVASAFRFKSAHLSFSQQGGSQSSQWVSLGMNFDYNNYTMITSDELGRMHDACLFNMLHVPAVAKANQQ